MCTLRSSVVKDKKTDIKEIYIEVYEGSIGVVISTSGLGIGDVVNEYVSLEKFCSYFDRLSEYFI